MAERTIIPFGPQHPVLPEPIHLDLVVEDEKVIEVIPSIGFIHRGLEKLVENRDYNDFTYVAERICGICSFIHGLTYCQAVEKVLNVTVPPRAEYLRLVWSELSRIHSHLLWLGLIADSFGFESLFMYSWKMREEVLDIIEETTGGRVIFGSAKVGGVRRNIEKDKLAEIQKRLDKLEHDLKSITNVFIEDASVKHRLCGVGVLSKEDAYHLGAVGPMLRASGVNQDVRVATYAKYKELDFVPMIESSGDSYARTIVRIREVYQSFELIRRTIKHMPDSEIDVKVTGMPTGEFCARNEQPRGEVVYYIKGNGTKFLDRLRVRTPTFANIPALLKVLPGSDLADVPVLVLTIDPCISCTER
ncbi:MAG: nickel-dependent hydrogenase large subunit [Oligoflexia bacterium]|nr:nickel-dependent hydrogenase large subunit [Oligoflexia bacterium]MBF0364364.1 nickel-dependent hydrogenase large subunit [Oligoflexia bacterium]